jgi:hypothetical protein
MKRNTFISARRSFLYETRDPSLRVWPFFFRYDTCLSNWLIRLIDTFFLFLSIFSIDRNICIYKERNILYSKVIHNQSNIHKLRVSLYSSMGERKKYAKLVLCNQQN